MSRQKTINVYGTVIVDSETDDDGLTLVLRSAKYCVRVRLSDFLVGITGQRLNEHLNRRQHAIDIARKRLRGES